MVLFSTSAALLQESYVKAPNAGNGDGFGAALAVAGNTLAVGAPGEASGSDGPDGNPQDDSAPEAGAVYLFSREGGNWVPQAYLKAARSDAGDRFGSVIALSGDTIAIGVARDDSAATGLDGDAGDNSSRDSGAVYIFVRQGTNWVQQAYLKAPNSDTDDGFGSAVALSDDTLVVGAPYEDSRHASDPGDNSLENAGAVWVFTRTGSTWTPQAILKAARPDARDFFGAAVAISGDRIAVGAPYEDSFSTGINGDASNNGAEDAGAVYVFERDGVNWSQRAYVKSSRTQWFQSLGNAVALEGDTLVASLAPARGVVHVFRREAGGWVERAPLKLQHESSEHLFGDRIALRNGQILVAAPGDSGIDGGVNGDPTPSVATESGAAYLFAEDGSEYRQVAYLKASHPEKLDGFGRAIALDDGLVVGGAPGEDSAATAINGDPCDNSLSSAGAVYVFNPESTATVAPRFTAETASGEPLTAGMEDLDFGDLLPSNVARREIVLRNIGTSRLTGLTAVIEGPDAADFKILKAPPSRLTGPCGVARFAVVFRASEPGSRRARLRLSADSAEGLPFEIQLKGVALPGRITVTGGNSFTALNSEPADGLGHSVAVSGDTLVVGAPFEASAATGVNGDSTSNAASGSGAAYVFVRDGDNWIQQAYLKAPHTEIGDDRFGYRVAISGDTLVVTAVGEDSSARGVDGPLNDNRANSSGAAYVYVRNGFTWSLQAYLKASNAGEYQYFGASAAISGDTILIGADHEDRNATGVNGVPQGQARSSGAAYVFVRLGTTWSQQAYLKASNTGFNDQFGWSVALDGDTAVVGAIGESSNARGVNGDETSNTAPQAGAAYVFVRNGTEWTQQAYLKASNSRISQGFGASVAVSGNTVVVGAPGESSSATGVGGIQTDTSSPGAGAAYVFIRRGDTWLAQAYLKPSNTSSEDKFGETVAMDGERVLVGALLEDGRGQGVAADPLSDGLGDSGAAYLFVREGDSWTQHAYLKAPAPKPDQKFGSPLALNQDWMCFGIMRQGIAGLNTGAAVTYRLSTAPPRLTARLPSAGRIRLQLLGRPGRGYRLERSPSFAGPWQSVQGITTSDTGLAEMDDAAPPGEANYYRAVMVE